MKPETAKAVWSEYLHQEKAANKTPQGADVDRLIRNVAAQFDMPVTDVAAIVRDRSAGLRG